MNFDYLASVDPPTNSIRWLPSWPGCRPGCGRAAFAWRRRPPRGAQSRRFRFRRGPQQVQDPVVHILAAGGSPSSPTASWTPYRTACRTPSRIQLKKFIVFASMPNKISTSRSHPSRSAAPPGTLPRDRRHVQGRFGLGAVPKTPLSCRERGRGEGGSCVSLSLPYLDLSASLPHPLFPVFRQTALAFHPAAG